MIDPEKILSKLERASDTHKGENGKLLVIGGSKDYTGAPALTAQAALRSGADLVRIYCPQEIKSIVAGFSENLIVDTYESSYFDHNALENVQELLGWADTIVIGPGLGATDLESVAKVLDNSKPKVIDADALQAAKETDVTNAVMTPHAGEMDNLRAKVEVSEILENDNIILEKGERDKIHSTDETLNISGGNPGMTVGGTGDVLAGIAGALIAQGFDKDESAALASWANKQAGDRAYQKNGNGLVATDLIEEIPRILFR